MKYIFIIGIIVLSSTGFGQGVIRTNDTLLQYFGSPVEVRDKDFIREYNRLKPIVLKVYPYALSSADILDEMNNDLESIKKRRKRKKFCNRSYKALKKDFKYVFMDLYTFEGKVLTKLVARETGLSIYQITTKYRGQKEATMFNLMSKIWDQDIKKDYDYKNEYVLEAVIADIESGKIKFNSSVTKITKAEFKDKKKATNIRVKENHKKIKAIKKKKSKKKRMTSKT